MRSAPAAPPGRETLEARPGAEPGSDAARRSLALLRELLDDYGPRDFAIRLWDGTSLPPEAGEDPRFTLVLRHPGSLRTLLWPPTQLAMSEAYLYDDIDIEGDIGGVFRLADHLLARPWTPRQRFRLGRKLLALPSERWPHAGQQPARLTGRQFSLGRDRQAVSYHYDRSNEFFALYLDPRMVYSCAYFAAVDEDLGAAQERKLDYLCRKLALRPGERLLDIGCGWGGLLLHAAERYGVEAVGITLSERQAELARERIRQAGLGSRCRVELVDYRELDELEAYDKVVSVCMFEQVGEGLLPGFFARAWRLLRPGGVFVNQGIARSADFDRTARRGRSFMNRYVFPDGGVVPIGTTLAAVEQAGFEIRDVESLREHYILTLGHWVRRLEAAADAARHAADEVTYRVWRLYMAGSAYGFETGRLNLYQLVAAKPEHGRSGLPLTRAGLYVQEAGVPRGR
jgi:cyclopropane-fatty-acyl-phospholipid synthase